MLLVGGYCWAPVWPVCGSTEWNTVKSIPGLLWPCCHRRGGGYGNIIPLSFSNDSIRLFINFLFFSRHSRPFLYLTSKIHLFNNCSSLLLFNIHFFLSQTTTIYHNIGMLQLFTAIFFHVPFNLVVTTGWIWDGSGMDFQDSLEWEPP